MSDEKLTHDLAQEIARDYLGIDPEGGEWGSDGSDNFWEPDYTEEECKKVARIEMYINKTIVKANWKKIATGKLK